MDFCAGIWCWRLWLEMAWFQCVAFSEINAKAEGTYRTFFGNEEKNYWDLMKINTDELPNFDLLIAWFPCQTFSVIWQRKGMEDPRWQIIFWIEKILKEKNIKYFILENVKWLVNHEWWKTMQSIIDLLNKAWYYVTWKVLNTIDYWLPQSRERVYFFWVRKDLAPFTSKLSFPKKIIKKPIHNFLIEHSDHYILSENRTTTLIRYLNNKYNQWKYSIPDLISKEWFIIDTRQSDIRFYDWFAPTLRTWRHWLLYSRNWLLRELSGFESLLLQWIPVELAEKTSHILDKDLLWQSWNAMSVNVIYELWKEFLHFIHSNTPQDAWSNTTMIKNSKTVISEWIRRHNNIQQLARK
jgi:DNA (cytosine-5)-methyltransferase 1